MNRLARLIPTLLVVTTFLLYAAQCESAGSQCPQDEATFASCRGNKGPITRRGTIDRLFRTFDFDGDGVIEHGVLEKAYSTLLTPAMRHLVGDSPDNIYEHCDTDPRDGKFQRAEIDENKCDCIENCRWAIQVNAVCQMAENHPGWYEA